ncbi:MAG TPA: dethiobiotin synthase [Chromatiales bacterium]|nr:dethiobiotin synthase [Chromatiales bacterium]HEX22941.1 dethiobiotin synthase [Chromatiales bacterium]
MAGLFVTGTDTDVGKTHIALGLMAALQQRGLCVAAMKPVSAGCELGGSEGDRSLRNDDALQLSAQSSLSIPYQTLNPYAFEPAIAPHIAAQKVDVTMRLDVLQRACAEIEAQADVVVVEGAGGWLVPVNARETLADLAVALGFPVVLVVGVRLGCISHALLSAESIRARGLTLAGWVANEISTQAVCVEENIAALSQRLQAPLLGRVPFDGQAGAERTAASLNITPLLASVSAGGSP